VVVAARQQLTREWWQEYGRRFSLHVSVLVVREASAGDRDAATRRLRAIEHLPVLELKEDAMILADHLVVRRAIPAGSAEDALHIALAAAHGMDYLLTWNFAHLANAIMRERIETVVMDSGLRCPVICTPEELMER